MIKILVREVLERTIAVEADSVETALNLVAQDYRNGDIILDSGDFSYHEIEYIED